MTPAHPGVHAADLDRLQAEFPQWRIWRAYDRGRPAGWVATRLLDDDVEPTITAGTAEQLEARLVRPGRRAGRGLSRAQLAAIEQRLAETGGGGPR